MNNLEKYGTATQTTDDNIIQRMRIASWITKATDTHLEYVLTLRLLMSYIYMEHLFLMFLDHTQRRSTVGRTPLDE